MGPLYLIERHLMPGFIHACEAEIAVLTSLSILDTVDDQWCVAGGAERVGTTVVELQRNGFAAEPVANVLTSGQRTFSNEGGIGRVSAHICVAMVHCNSHSGVDYALKVSDEREIHEITCLLEGPASLVRRSQRKSASGRVPVNVVVRVSVVEVDPNSLLDVALIEVILKKGGGSGIVVGVSNVVDSSAAVLIIGTLEKTISLARYPSHRKGSSHLNIVSTQVSSLRTDCLP